MWALAGAGAVVAVLARTPWTALMAAATTAFAVVSLSDRAAPYVAGVTAALLVAAGPSATANAFALATARPLSARHDAMTVRDQMRLPARFVASRRLPWLQRRPAGPCGYRRAP